MNEKASDTLPDSSPVTTAAGAPAKIDGVVVGVLLDLPAPAKPVVAFPGNTELAGSVARSTATLTRDDIGCQVALLFEGGDPGRPLVIGRIQRSEPTEATLNRKALTAEVDGENVLLEAKKEIVLRCGKASITLTRAGKIIIRGAYLLSRSSGVNRIKGGSVQIN